MLQQIFTTIVGIVFPPFCFYCRVFLDQRTPLCVHCVARIQPVISKKIAVTATKELNVYAVGSYSDPLTSLILAKASKNVHGSYQLAYLMWNHTVLKHAEYDVLVPIPLHWRRQMQRGFNQAERIGVILSEKSGKPLKHFLKRVRHTPFLSSVSVAQREMLIKNVFELACRPADVAGKRIVLVDDLCTTGATLKAAAKVLYKAGAASVDAVVGARII